MSEDFIDDFLIHYATVRRPDNIILECGHRVEPCTKAEAFAVVNICRQGR
jgi:hypothetical protein